MENFLSKKLFHEATEYFCFNSPVKQKSNEILCFQIENFMIFRQLNFGAFASKSF